MRAEPQSRGGDWPEILRRIAVTPDRDEIESQTLLSRIETTLERGFSACMVREKRLGDPEFAEFGRQVKRRVEARGGHFILNERLSLLETLRPDIFHATFRSPALEVIRERAYQIDLSELRVGVSVHDEVEARDRVAEGFDYLVFGPVFETPSKVGRYAARGLTRLGELCRELSVPVVAIGGISFENEAAIREAGAAGVAMMRAAWAVDEEGAS